MKQIDTLLKAIIILVIIAGMNIPLHAQHDMTITPMRGIPQSNYNNPGLIPECKIHIGILPIATLPVMPSLYIDVINTGLYYNDIIQPSSIDSMNIICPDNAFDALAKKNYISTNLNMEILSFGFKYKRRTYFSLGLYEKINTRFCYPRDLIALGMYGNAQFLGDKADFSGLGINATHYRELAIGYSYKPNDKWTYGGRVKLLFGLANVWTKKSNLSIGFDEDTYAFDLNSEMIINMCVPEPAYSEVSGDTSRKTDFNPMDYIFNTRNLGAAIDLGATYKCNDKFSLALSAIDLGYIKWKSGNVAYTHPKTNFVFDGFDIVPYIRKQDSNLMDILQGTLDTLQKTYTIDTSLEAYWCPLNPSIFLTGYYFDQNKSTISLTGRFEFYNKTVHPTVTLGYYKQFGRTLGFAFNYSYMHRDFFNLGIGTFLKIGPAQIWLTTDDILAAVIPYMTKNVNIHLGCNLLFFYKNHYPLVGYESCPKWQ